MAQTREQKTRRTVIGVVTSAKMKKTITVQVTAKLPHEQFKKYVNRTQVYKAHDEKGEAQLGDRVEIMETRPLSKTKNFRLLKILTRGRIPANTPEVNALADAGAKAKG